MGWCRKHCSVCLRTAAGIGLLGRAIGIHNVQLRQKFGLLALIYVLSLSVNFAMSAWCIVVYFRSAFMDVQTGTMYEQKLAEARKLLERQRTLFEENPNPIARQESYQERQQRLTELIGEIDVGLLTEWYASLRPAIHQAIDHKNQEFKQWLVQAEGATSTGKMPEDFKRSINELDKLLLQASRTLSRERDVNVAQAATTQEQVLMILGANAACGAILCAAGVYFVRRWVMRPITDLREATRHISKGDFAYRVKPRAHDELGHLALEVNQMAATVVDMQTRLVEHERLAAAGEMVTRLAHNIRNPLAGIRGLAEATLGQHADDTDTVGCQQRIIDTVDRFEKWLRDLQQSVSPLELKPKKIVIRDMINDVITALQPMLDRHHVRIEVDVGPDVLEAQLDSLHFEQALVALVTNAVQASQSGQVVWIRAHPDDQDSGRWQLTVEDEGAGIPPEIRQKIFQPYFTTKPEGNGIGLAMAHKVVRLHGGQLTVESELGAGSRFNAVMPGLTSEA